MNFLQEFVSGGDRLFGPFSDSAKDQRQLSRLGRMARRAGIPSRIIEQLTEPPKAMTVSQAIEAGHWREVNR